jgi:hypothetical protein
LLKICIYGHVNRIQSSRRLEREAERNVELMRLLVTAAMKIAMDVGGAIENESPFGFGASSRCRFRPIASCEKV